MWPYCIDTLMKSEMLMMRSVELNKKTRSIRSGLDDGRGGCRQVRAERATGVLHCGEVKVLTRYTPDNLE